MQWSDEGIVLTARNHGETAAIVTVFSREYGRYAGLVAGGQGRASRPVIQSGNKVSATWKARLSEQLGYFSLEPMSNRWARWLDNREVLSIIASASEVAEASLPERQPMPLVYDGLSALLDTVEAELWGALYVKWEIELLGQLGYGLNLESCALTGATDGLTHVSPRSGRAVTAEAAQPYLDKLLPLPKFLTGEECENLQEEVLKGLEMTGYFLSHHVFSHPQNRRLVPNDGDLPPARGMLESYFRVMEEKGLFLKTGG